MKRILLIAFLILLTGCTPEPVIVEVPGETIVVEVEKPVYIETEIIEIVEVEVYPEGYVDSYYYCHEDEVYDMVDSIIYAWNKYQDYPVVYREEGYDGYPSIEIEGDEIDVWDLMLNFCSFDHTNDRDGGI